MSDTDGKRNPLDYLGGRAVRPREPELLARAHQKASWSETKRKRVVMPKPGQPERRSARTPRVASATNPFPRRRARASSQGVQAAKAREVRGRTAPPSREEKERERGSRPPAVPRPEAKEREEREREEALKAKEGGRRPPQSRGRRPAATPPRRRRWTPRLVRGSGRSRNHLARWCQACRPSGAPQGRG